MDVNQESFAVLEVLIKPEDDDVPFHDQTTSFNGTFHSGNTHKLEQRCPEMASVYPVLAKCTVVSL